MSFYLAASRNKIKSMFHVTGIKENCTTMKSVKGTGDSYSSQRLVEVPCIYLKLNSDYYPKVPMTSAHFQQVLKPICHFRENLALVEKLALVRNNPAIRNKRLSNIRTQMCKPVLKRSWEGTMFHRNLDRSSFIKNALGHRGWEKIRHIIGQRSARSQLSGFNRALKRTRSNMMWNSKEHIDDKTMRNDWKHLPEQNNGPALQQPDRRSSEEYPGNSNSMIVENYHQRPVKRQSDPENEIDKDDVKKSWEGLQFQKFLKGKRYFDPRNLVKDVDSFVSQTNPIKQNDVVMTGNGKVSDVPSWQGSTSTSGSETEMHPDRITSQTIAQVRDKRSWEGSDTCACCHNYSDIYCCYTCNRRPNAIETETVEHKSTPGMFFVLNTVCKCCSSAQVKDCCELCRLLKF